MLCPFMWIVVLLLPTTRPSVDGQIKLCCNDTFPFTVSPQFGPPLADATPPPRNTAAATTNARPNKNFVGLTLILLLLKEPPTLNSRREGNTRTGQQQADTSTSKHLDFGSTSEPCGRRTRCCHPR